MIKKNTGILIIIFIGFFSLWAIKSLYVSPSKYRDSRSAFNRPDVEKEMDKHAQTLLKVEDEAYYEELSMKLAHEGKYDEAIKAAQEALNYTLGKKAGSWMARRNLGRIYEQAGKYDLALKELEWAESVQTRPDVLSQLAEDRKRLEVLSKKK